MAFATPTANMAVRAGQYVSGEGRIYHPYLAGWREDVSLDGFTYHVEEKWVCGRRGCGTPEDF